MDVRKYDSKLGTTSVFASCATFLLWRVFLSSPFTSFAVDPRHCEGEVTAGSLLASLAVIAWVASLCLSVASVVLGMVFLRGWTTAKGLVALCVVVLNIGNLASADSMRVRDGNAIANLRGINTAQVTYLSMSGGSYGTLSELARVGLVPDFEGTYGGYRYQVTLGEGDYTATASPVGHSPNEGCWEYFSTTNALILYSTDPSKAPPGNAGTRVP
jgi:hypothetical protein